MKTSIASAVSFVLLSSLVTAHAQTQGTDASPASAPTGEEQKKEAEKKEAEKKAKPKAKEVISVTGSRIKRTEVESAAPIQIIDKEQIEKSGLNTVADIIREIPANSFGAVREEAGRGGASVSGANLRGLGEEYTLVLIDGRRLPADPVLEVVDVGEIPVAMIERVEILKEGASALYGSDAVGGVVNIITRKAKDGTSVLYSRTFTADKGGDEQRIEAVGGASNEKSSVMFAASYRDRSIVMARDREYSAEGWSPSGNPGSFVPLTKQADGTYKVATGDFFQPSPECQTTDLSRPSQGSGDRFCEFNYAKTASVSPSVNQLGLMMKFDHQLTDEIALFGFAKDSRRTSKWNYAPAPQRFDVTDPTAVAAIKNSLGAAGSGIDLGAEDGVRIQYRTTDLGTRDSLIQEKNSMGVLGLRGNVADWDWEYSFSKGRTWRNDVGIKGYWLISKMQELIKAGDYNPMDPARDPASLSDALHKPWSIESSDIESHNLSFTGSVGKLAGGDIGLAFGVSRVEEGYKIYADDQTLRDEVAGSSASLGEGKRNYQSLYAEVGLPVSKELELDLAARFDDYSDVGSTTNPRLAAKYKLDTVLFRASVGTGFRAPSLQSINDEGGYGYPAFVDAVACNTAKSGGNAADIADYCGQQQYLVETIAAEDLKPEKTLFGNVGVVFEPNRNYNVGLDFWMLRIKDKIGIPDYYLLTKAELDGETGYESAGISILRDGNGFIDTLTVPKANLSKVETAGIDLTGGVTFGERSATQFSWNLDTSYSLYYKEAAYDGQALVDRIGTVGKPQWKMANTFTTITSNVHIAGLTARTNSGSEKANPEAGDIPIHTEWDAQYTWNAFYNGSISVGAVNIFDRKPPTDETQTPTVDLAIYNNLGRSAYVKVTQDF